MKPWLALFVISGGFTALGFVLMWSAPRLELGMMMCFAAFVFGNYLGRRVFDRMRAAEETER